MFGGFRTGFPRSASRPTKVFVNCHSLKLWDQFGRGLTRASGGIPSGTPGARIPSEELQSPDPNPGLSRTGIIPPKPRCPGNPAIRDGGSRPVPSSGTLRDMALELSQRSNWCDNLMGCPFGKIRIGSAGQIGKSNPRRMGNHHPWSNQLESIRAPKCGTFLPRFRIRGLPDPGTWDPGIPMSRSGSHGIRFRDPTSRDATGYNFCEDGSFSGDFPAWMGYARTLGSLSRPGLAIQRIRVLVQIEGGEGRKPPPSICPEHPGSIGSRLFANLEISSPLRNSCKASKTPRQTGTPKHASWGVVQAERLGRQQWWSARR